MSIVLEANSSMENLAILRKSQGLYCILASKVVKRGWEISGIIRTDLRMLTFYGVFIED
jgi:hypothetical protein